MSDRQIGKYKIIEEVGRGGFGTVYRARDTLLDREVALKVLHPQLLIDPDFLARFQQEARTAAALKHPHIVTIHELGEAEGVWYIAMEFLEGRPLDRLIRSEGPLAPDQALTIARDIGAALDYAHGRRLVHRDVKPSNILIDAEGRATLTDFGLVRAALLSTLSTTMGLIGTPAYMSPEQCEGEELDGRSDLYALGVVLYEMLTGRAPFRAETPLAVMRGHTDKPPPPPRKLNPALAAEVEPVLLMALAKKRDERYQGGTALADALDQALQAETKGAEQAERLAGLAGQARAAVQAKDWADVLAACQEIAAIDPSYPDLPALRAQVEEGQRRQAREAAEQERQARLTGLYEQIVARERSGDWAGVVELARRIETEQPGYRDVAQRLAGADSRLRKEKERARRESAERERQAGAVYQEHVAGSSATPPPTTAARRPLGWVWFVAGLLVAAVLVGIISATISSNPGPTAEPTRAAGIPTVAATETHRPTESVLIGTAEFKCTDTVGCVEVGPTEPIRIAYMMVVSGPDASLGQDTKYGVEIAIDDKGGTLLGHKIELIGEDTLCSAEGGQTAATKLAADPKLAGVVGTSCSSEARAALPIMCAQSIPMISASNTAPDLTAEDRPADYWCYMRTAHNDLVQGKAMAQYAWEKGFKKAATCHDGSLYADKLQQVFAEEFKKLGGAITAQEAVAPTDTDMKPMLTRVAATGPDFFYYPIFIAAGAQITSQAKQTPGMENVQLAGADGIFSADFLKAAGDAGLGMNWSSPDFSAFGGGYADFLVKYKAKSGGSVLAPFHAHAYDAASIIFNAIEKVAIKDADGSLLIPRKALVAAMLATKDHKGITGNLTCTITGDCADPKIAVYQCMSADLATWNPGSGPDDNPRKIWP